MHTNVFIFFSYKNAENIQISCVGNKKNCFVAKFVELQGYERL